MMASKIDKLKIMKNLVEKEKMLHKEIKSDFKKISQKINDDFDMVKKSKLEK